MSPARFAASSLQVALRWTARLVSGYLIGLVAVLVVGEGGFDPSKLTATEAVQGVLFFITVVAMVAAWRWELVGGAVSTTALLFFFAIEIAVTGGPPKGFTFPLMLLPGPLFIVCGLIKRRSFIT